MKTVRCAIYTRKSSDEGLDQAFNSLDAQREACAAYILSQASEGWVALPDIYDDGGLSGGTLDRPALQRLLSDVKAGRIDTIIVYKVDRLTRSLMDFSKLVEAFDNAGTSFVSVTQSFNTTTSMGRLTLNMLLSFAQFEREVTAERIRDKIAASKAKGMWMGGTPPIGYEPEGRSLKVVEDHAAIVRRVFDLYLELGNVRAVREQLVSEEVRSPVRVMTKTGKTYGGILLSRGQIYNLLNCPTYIGEVHHNGQVYPGLHKGVVDRNIWDRVQAMLADNLQGHRTGRSAATPSLLADKVVDAEGAQLISTHACKGKVRYRYYVSRDLQHGDGKAGMRIPARELEAAVARRVAELFEDGLLLATTAKLGVPVSDFGRFVERSSRIALKLAARDLVTVRRVIDGVRIHDGGIEIDCSTSVIAGLLDVMPEDDAPTTLTVTSDVRLTRSGLAMRLIQGNGQAVAPQADQGLIKLLVRARGWWAQLKSGEVDVKRLAGAEGVHASYISRVLRLAFLSPAMVDAILRGEVPPGIDVARLIASHAISPIWTEQRRAILGVSKA